jgi:hypothetical protein
MKALVSSLARQALAVDLSLTDRDHLVPDPILLKRGDAFDAVSALLDE